MVKIFFNLKETTRMPVRPQEASIDTSYLNRMGLWKKCFGVVDWTLLLSGIKTENPKIINVKWKGPTSLPCPLNFAELYNPFLTSVILGQSWSV